MTSDLENMYKEIILEHNESPRNFGDLEGTEIRKEGYNPICGDRVQLGVTICKNGLLSECKFKGEGCSICMASASMMTEEVLGTQLSRVEKSISDMRELMLGSIEPEELDSDLEALAGVRRFPVRIKCALLPWMTLRDAIKQGKSLSLVGSATTTEGSHD